jgi:hypothetical protein
MDPREFAARLLASKSGDVAIVRLLHGATAADWEVARTAKPDFGAGVRRRPPPSVNRLPPGVRPLYPRDEVGWGPEYVIEDGARLVFPELSEASDGRTEVKRGSGGPPMGVPDTDHEPDQAELDGIADAYTARNCGVRPTVRVVESFAIPPYVVEDPGPVCEELLETSGHAPDGRRR